MVYDQIIFNLEVFSATFQVFGQQFACAIDIFLENMIISLILFLFSIQQNIFSVHCKAVNVYKCHFFIKKRMSMSYHSVLSLINKTLHLFFCIELRNLSTLPFVNSIFMVLISLSIFMIKNATINPPDTNAVNKTKEIAHFQENSDHVAGVAIFVDGALYEPFLQ